MQGSNTHESQKTQIDLNMVLERGEVCVCVCGGGGGGYCKAKGIGGAGAEKVVCQGEVYSLQAIRLGRSKSRDSEGHQSVGNTFLDKKDVKDLRACSMALLA